MTIAVTTPHAEPICGGDSWIPLAAQIVSVRQQNFNTVTYSLRLADESLGKRFRFAPGQFNMIYVPGVGEAAISISSDADKPQLLDHTIRIVGSVTKAIDRIGKGPEPRTVGLRGPFGKGWPIDRIDGHNVVLVAGGIGLAPIRPMISWLLSNRHRCKRIVLLFGCRTPEDRLFVDELEQWSRQFDVLVTVDNATGDWTGPVGVVTDLLQRIKVDARKTIVMVCGPKVMNQAAAWDFLQLQVPPEQVYVSMERNMNCGFGRCGHCQYGKHFVCTDGPVFRFDEIADVFGVKDI